MYRLINFLIARGWIDPPYTYCDCCGEPRMGLKSMGSVEIDVFDGLRYEEHLMGCPSCRSKYVVASAVSTVLSECDQ